MNKCVFLDRDGVLNQERGEYTFDIEDFIITKGVKTALEKLKKNNFLLIVITNQGGIAKGLYTREHVLDCHNFLQENTGYLLDALYYSPYHPNFTESLSRKPDTLMFERAISKFNIDPLKSWMIGDSDRDIISAEKLNIKGLRVNKPWEKHPEYCNNLAEAVDLILSK
jgi:D-glycero-D-manno-heptose 1,7-bisphosphate phosphatase